MKNNNLILILVCLCYSTLFAQLKPVPPCINGNAEKGTFVNWATYTGTAVNPQTNASFTQSFNASKFGVHNSLSSFQISGYDTMLVNGIDYYGGFAVPNEGTYCFRIGNNVSSAHAEIMRYTFTVTAANAMFKFRYALVLEDPGHVAEEQPNFTFYMNRGAAIDPASPADFSLYNTTVNSISADLKNPFFNVSPKNAGVVYKGWQCVQYNLTPYIGQVVSFCARVRGCTLSGHFGYAYIDGLCIDMPATPAFTLNKTQYCLTDPISMDASLSNGEDRYFVEVMDVASGVAVSEWFINQPAPAFFDIRQFYQSKGKSFECGKSYRIKLAVSSQCALWNETSKIISIFCPTIFAGKDVTKCCPTQAVSSGVTFGEPAEAGYSYTWTSNPAGLVPVAAQNNSYLTVSANSIQSVAYTLTKVNGAGCSASGVVVLRVKPRYTVQIAKLPYAECDNRTQVKAKLVPIDCAESQSFLAQYPQNDVAKVKWYWKPSNSSVQTYLGMGSAWAAPNGDGILSAIYSDSCPGSVSMASLPIALNPVTHNHGLIAPNAFTPDDGTYNNIFRVLEYGPLAPLNIGDGPAYDASDFRLRLWNRWGENFVTVDKSTIGRTGALLQGDIQWNGKLNGVVQDGVYSYTLEMKYCGSSNFVQVQTPNAQQDMCVRWVWLFCMQRISGWASMVVVLK